VNARFDSDNVMKLKTTDQDSKRNGHARGRRLCAFAVSSSLLLLSAACAQDPQKEVRQELQTLSSWAATLHLLADSWREGSVPSRYAAKTADDAHETLMEESQTIQQSSSIPADAREVIKGHARNIHAAAMSLAQAVRNEDRGAAAQLSGQLSDEQKSVDDLARGAGAQGQ
jgi:hypothetical protein